MKSYDWQKQSISDRVLLRLIFMTFDNCTEINNLNHKCEEHKELRERVVGRGTAYVMQCTFCGYQVGQSIAKMSVEIIPEPFDINLSKKYESKYQSLRERWVPEGPAIPTIPLHDKFEQELDALLNRFAQESPTANEDFRAYLLNSYLTRKSDQYHKVDRSHWKSESQIKDWFSQVFSRWFYIYPEVRGVGLINGKQKNIIIDFVIIAKPDLVNAGFTSMPIGVEAKYIKFKTGDAFTRNASKGVFQALSYWYSNSSWNIPNSSSNQLACVMLMSNLSFKNERDVLENEPSKSKWKVWKTFLNLANNGNVGEIQYRHTPGNNHDTWAFTFGGGQYFSRKIDGTFKMGNPNMINKERIGNIK